MVAGASDVMRAFNNVGHANPRAAFLPARESASHTISLIVRTKQPVAGKALAAGTTLGMTTPSPPAEQATARQDQAGQSSTDDRAGYQLVSDFTTGKIHGVNVKISQMAL